MARIHTDAVSPVVGVMLMLVVTIIIAAIVSAFAGGISTSTTKAPNVQIAAHYSQSQGMWFENDGPDDISTVSTNVYVRLSDSFGGAEHQVWAVNKTYISNSSSITNPGDGSGSGSYNTWLTAAGMTGVKTFRVGERAYILPPYHNSTYLQQGTGTSATSPTYAFNNTVNLGNSFWLELTDKNGKIFSRTKVKIEA